MGVLNGFGLFEGGKATHERERGTEYLVEGQLVPRGERGFSDILLVLSI
jgi:hypothetical protein